MSCMYLSKDHYQFIADSLYRITVQFQDRIEFHETRRRLFDGLNSAERETKILAYVNRLRTWNLQAYSERYPGEVEKGETADRVKRIGIVGGNGNVRVEQLLKALQCLHYQCIDARKFEDSEEAKDLEVIMREARDCIIDSLPAYRDAHWSIDDRGQL
jgi:hypothetical protein